MAPLPSSGLGMCFQSGTYYMALCCRPVMMLQWHLQSTSASIYSRQLLDLRITSKARTPKMTKVTNSKIRRLESTQVLVVPSMRTSAVCKAISLWSTFYKRWIGMHAPWALSLLITQTLTVWVIKTISRRQLTSVDSHALWCRTPSLEKSSAALIINAKARTFRMKSAISTGQTLISCSVRALTDARPVWHQLQVLA